MSYLRLPPPDGNLLVPTSGRQAFIAGLSMWSASRRAARAVQWAYWALAKTVGPKWIPGSREDTAWSVAGDAFDHRQAWHRWFGEFDDVAAYSPSQSERRGLALLLLQSGKPRGFVKCRPRWDPAGEIAIVGSLAGAETFEAPQVVGSFEAEGWTSVGFAPMPGRIHSPVLRTPVSRVADEVSALLRPVIGGSDASWSPMHGDMGPWNLRQPPDARPVLFDWEHAGLGPPGADIVFHSIASQAMGVRSQVDIASWGEARVFWSEEIPRRFGSGRRDARLAGQMLEVLLRYDCD